MTKKITLYWVHLIKKRLKEYNGNRLMCMDFIKPILEYGEAEEKRINEEFDKRLKE